MPVSLVAMKRMRYGLGAYVAGEAFEARDEADANVLVLLKLASRVDTPSSVEAPEPVSDPEPGPSADDESGDDGSDEPTADPEAPKRRYRRRDMQAE
jgi:hypothetical protein